MPNRQRLAKYFGSDEAMAFAERKRHLVSIQWCGLAALQGSQRVALQYHRSPLARVIRTKLRCQNSEPRSPLARFAQDQQRSNAIPIPNVFWGLRTAKCIGTEHVVPGSEPHKKHIRPPTIAGLQTPEMRSARSHRGTFECRDSCSARHRSAAWYDPHTSPQM